MSRGLEEVRKLGVKGAVGGRIEDRDVHSEDEEIGGTNMEEHGAQTTCVGGIRSKGNSCREAWTSNEELSANG